MKPRKVKEQAERAKKLQEDLIRRKKGEAASLESASDSDDPSTAIPLQSGQPIAAEAGGDDDFLPPGAADESDDQQGGQAAGEQFLPEPAAAAAPDQEEWKHKYNVLQGKYNAEMAAMHTRLGTLEGLLASMGDRGASGGGNGLDPKTDEIIATLKDQYPDIADAIVATIDSRFKQVQPKIEQRVGSLEAHASKTREDAFYDALDRNISGWEKVNVHPVFLAWLAELDDMTGQKRSELLRAAYSALDSRRVANIFIRFRNEKGWVKAETPAAQRMAADANGRGASVDVHPSASGSGGPPPQRRASKKIVSRGEIAKFYDDVRRGKYRTRPKEKAAFEQEMALAAREGRVR